MGRRPDMLAALRTASRRAQPTITQAAVRQNMIPGMVQTRSFASFLDVKDVEERVITVLKGFEKVDTGKLSPSSHFKNDLGLDSLDTVEIPDAEAEKIQSCEEAIKYVAAHP